MGGQRLYLYVEARNPRLAYSFSSSKISLKFPFVWKFTHITQVNIFFLYG